MPVKNLARAKARLAPDFDAARRAALARALLSDALGLCSAVPWLQWWVVTDDDEAGKAADRSGLSVHPDAGRGLNAALRAALGAVAEAGASSATIVSADVPLARSEDIRDIVDTGATSDVVVVPSRAGGGTNALHLSPPRALEPCFGPASLRAHVDAADRRGLRCSILPLARLALDVDTATDAGDLLTIDDRRVSHAARYLSRLEDDWLPASPV